MWSRHTDPDDFKSMGTGELIEFLYMEAPDYGTTPAAGALLLQIGLNELRRRPFSVQLFEEPKDR